MRVKAALSRQMKNSFLSRPAGTIRITSMEDAAKTILWPVLRELMITYPDIKTDITLDYGLTDIVAERFDAGVRLGEDVDKDMIALRISPDIPMAIVGALSYFDKAMSELTVARPYTPATLPRKSMG